MKIAFLLGSPEISGGTYVIFQHALGLTQRGHLVTLVTEQSVTSDQIAWHAEAVTLRFATFVEIGPEQFDIVFATWWRTVYSLHRVNARTYAYFCQSIESRFYPAHDQAAQYFAESTYTAQLPVITEARWIQEYLQSGYGRTVEPAPNGIRKDIYTVSGEAFAARVPGALRVLVEGPLGVPFKNVERTIELCRRAHPNEIWLLTATPNVNNFPGVDRVFSKVSIADTAKIYRSADVLVKLSYVEGMFGPPLEMFHCGGTAIVYRVTGVDEYIRAGENAIVCDRDDEPAVIAAINSLKSDTAYLTRLKMEGLRTASGWPSWSQATERFEGAMQRISVLPCENRLQLQARAQLFTAWYETHLQHQEFARAGSLLATLLHKMRVLPLAKRIYRVPYINRFLKGILSR
jgi:glycosyltransferase involved in cell wall biosynthesis